MVEQLQKKIIILALFAGEIMVKSGAEIYRVEDTITRICKACNIPYVEAYATPTSLFLSVDKGEHHDMTTYIKSIKGSKTDLGKIAETNQFSRDFVSTDLSIEDGMDWLRRISQKEPYPFWIRVLFAALGCACFSIMFDGGVKDFICTLFVGAVTYIVSVGIDMLQTNYFIKGVFCTGVAALLALTCAMLGLGTSSGAITIGTLMLFVPGVAITNALRDFLSGDMVSGLVRMAEAFVVAVSLGVGAGIVLKTWVMLGGTII